MAPTARLIGRVSVAERSSIWPGAVLRADHEPIIVGRETSIQDNTVVHADPGEPVTIGDRVTIGHGAVIHACTIGDDVLVGMGAIILNGAVIGDGAMVGAGAVVGEGKVVEPRTLVAGVPAKPVRAVSEDEVLSWRKHAEAYWAMAERYRRQDEPRSGRGGR